MLLALAKQSNTGLVLESASGAIAGFGFLRPGAQASYLGPVVANSAAAGLALVEALIARNPGQRVYWDIPDPNPAAVAWAEDHRFAIQRPLLRMCFGENIATANPSYQFALAGPEVG